MNIFEEPLDELALADVDADADEAIQSDRTASALQMASTSAGATARGGEAADDSGAVSGCAVAKRAAAVGALAAADGCPLRYNAASGVGVDSLSIVTRPDGGSEATTRAARGGVSAGASGGAVRQPVSFAHGNLVFGRDMDDAWALYRLETRSYAGLTRVEKREVLSQLAAFAYTIEADFTLLRVARAWSIERYRASCEAASSHHAHSQLLARYLDSHELALTESAAQRPEVYLSVRLSQPRESEEAFLSAAGIRRWFGLADARAISAKRLTALEAKEAKVYARVADFLACDRAASHELQWLIRRSFTREVCDPVIEEAFTPQALVVEGDHGAGFKPLEADLLRLFDCPLDVGPRSLRIESEVGESHQAFLCLGARREKRKSRW